MPTDTSIAALPDVEPSLGARAVQRALSAVLEAAAVVDGGEVLEHAMLAGDEPPRLVASSLLEGSAMRAHRVRAEPDAEFAGFLDGTQLSRVLAYAAGVPIVHGVVAAVVRERRHRRLVTWQHRVLRRVYASKRAIPSAVWTTLERACGDELVDVSDAAHDGAHPFILRDAAVHRVQKDRERLEAFLAERWCHVERRPLFIDGGIGGSDRVATASCVVGVVKSHRTLYAEGDALATVLRLGAGERSSVVRIDSARRTPVASWYLRLRDPRGRDPMFGLVRVEVRLPEPGEDVATIAERTSAWVLAEVAPLAMPDSRWDKMVYGVRDCEQFLRAIG